MRKLIEISKKSLLVCDNEKCDYEIPYSEEEEKMVIKYINKPCPECGENLLTAEDYLTHEKLMNTVKWINKYFSWITFFYSKKSWNKRESVNVHVHNGIKINNK